MSERFATCCILSYERPEFLEEMLGTMVAHAAYPMEVIVHDDGSTNTHTRQWLHELVGIGAISTLIENPPGHNQGQGIALNRMFGMAKGDYIIKLDQDLLFKPNWLARAVEILDRNADEADRNSDIPHEFPEIGLLGLFKYEHEPVDYRKTLQEDFGFWEKHTHICGSGFVMTRRAWEEFGPFEERSAAFAEDYDMQCRVSDRRGWACGLPPEDLVANQGFGLGPSTVVVQKENGELTSRDIQTGPRLVRPEMYVGRGMS